MLLHAKNRKHGVDGRTDEQGAMLNVALSRPHDNSLCIASWSRSCMLITINSRF